MAFASVGGPVAERSANTIIICTPTGVKQIEWSFGEAPTPQQANALLCPLCIAATDISAPQIAATRAADTQFERYARLSAALGSSLGEASPYPARAPPV